MASSNSHPREVVVRVLEVRLNPPERRWMAHEYCVLFGRLIRQRYGATEAAARQALDTTATPVIA